MIKKNAGPALLLLFFVCLAYFNCLDNQFLWDDEFLVQKNEWLKSVDHLPKMLVSNSTAGFGGNDNFYRPTQNIYYLAIYQMFGLSEPAFHIGNILLHFINAILLFFLILRLFGSDRMALIASLLWVTHPTHVEAITYVSGTADPMATLFCLLSLLSFLILRPTQAYWGFGVSLLCYILALLSKEAIIVTPALLILVIFFSNTRQKRWHLKTYYCTLPYWLISFFYIYLRKTHLNFANTFQFFKTANVYTENIAYRILTYLATLPEYLEILFLPKNLHMERAFPVFTQISSLPVLLGLVVFFGGLIFSLYFYFRKSQDIPLFAWLWFFAAFVPMMGILIPVNSLLLEHWLYLPSMGLFVLFAKFLLKLDMLQSHFSLALTLLLAGTLSFATHQRNKVWADPISFYSDILIYSEGSARVHNNIAMAYSEKNDLDLAISHYQKAITLSDVYPQTRYNLARVYARKQQYDLALQQLEKSLEIDPNFIYAKRLKENILQFLKNKK